MKRITVITVVFLLIASFALSAEFWGSKNSNKYHYPNCKWAQKINPGNLVVFKSPNDAVKSGYIPCKVCKPPTGIKSEFDTENNINVAAVLSPEEERQGCCSHHGGVCGCQNGRAVCCDGTLSPSCGCD
jgi:hypothetical protein